MVSRASIDVLKEHFRNDVSKEDWILIKQLKVRSRPRCPALARRQLILSRRSSLIFLRFRRSCTRMGIIGRWQSILQHTQIPIQSA